MPTAAAPTAASPLWHLFMPPLFVVLWASGFVVTKLGVAFAEPFTFLLYRFLIVAALLGVIAVVMRAPWPRSWPMAGHIAVVGVLLQATYLGGVYAAIASGIPAGISALIIGVQPIITGVVVGPFLGERVSARQWLGLALGFLGIGLVLWQKLALDVAHLGGIAWNVAGLLGITAATLYQKKYCAMMDWRSGGVIQYAAAAAVSLVLTFATGETGRMEWSAGLLIAYAWLVFVLSLGAVSLFGWLIRRGEASRVASLLYLVPPTAALGGWLLFGETLGPLALAGMAVTVVGVALAVRR